MEDKMDNNYKLVDIEDIEDLGFYNDEWVYDLEMEDESHTFIANDILVHNTDSIFVSFKPAMDHCTWKDLVFNKEYLDSINEPFSIISRYDVKTDNPYLQVKCSLSDDDSNKLNSILESNVGLLLVDGFYLKNRKMQQLLSSNKLTTNIKWNWYNETDFIHGVDYFRIAGYFKDCLDSHAKSYGVENKEDFELERISESIINIAKKKYIQHIVFEDGIYYDRLNYFFPKGVELVRSSTPAFAREKIIDIVKYLFSNPDTFDIKSLLKLVKNLRKEFELADMDDISMQSSVSNYDTKVLNDKSLPLNFVTGAHFAVKSAAHYNHLLHKNKEYQQKYEFIKSGTKIKYYCCKDKSVTDMFAYIRGSYPIEFAPEIDFGEQFSKSILSPINSIIEPLGLPEITKRLTIVADVFGGFK
jgi:hypothetical protein